MHTPLPPPSCGFERRRLLGLAAGMGILGVYGGLARAAFSRVQPLRVAVARPQSMQHLPLTLAQALGYFRHEGLAVEVVDTETEDRAVQAVARGAAHVAVCAYASTISQQARGTPLQSILLSMRAPQVVLGVSLKTLGQYRSPSDLRGRRVGVLTQVAGSSLVLGMLLQQADLRLADITLVPSEDPADLLARYRAGQIDALSVNDPLMTLLEQRSEVRVVADTRSLRGSRDVFGGLMPGCAVCALPEFVRGQPAACQAMVDGLVHALKWLQTAGPSDIIKAVPEPHFDGDRAVYLSALDKLREGFAADGLLAPEHALTALRALSRLDRDVRLERIQLARTYTNEFAQKAKARFRA